MISADCPLEMSILAVVVASSGLVSGVVSDSPSAFFAASAALVAAAALASALFRAVIAFLLKLSQL